MKFTPHAHEDHKVAEWRDTAHLRWVERECKQCGRLIRRREKK